VLLSSEAAIRWRDSFGQNALHVLVKHDMSIHLLHRLIEECPEFVRETDHNGRLPLLIAIEFYHHARAETRRRCATRGPYLHRVLVPASHWWPVMRCLVEAFRGGACQADNNGMTPLMLACERHLRVKLIYLRVKASSLFFQNL